MPVLHVEARALGPEAAALRAARGAGRVLAAGRRAVYLESATGAVVGLVDATAPDGPLSLRVADLAAVQTALAASLSRSAHPQMRTEPAHGQRLPHEGAVTFLATPETLTLGERVHINWTAAPVWAPRLPTRVAPLSERQAAGAALVAAICTVAPAGAGAVAAELLSMDALTPAGAADADPVWRRLRAGLCAFQTAWAAGAEPAAADALIGLLGLGPGLTPSGDDLVAGLLAALVWQTRAGALPAAAVAPLVAAVPAAAVAHTTRLSARLLSYAAAGILYDPALALGAALLAGDASGVAAPAARLFALGATTGIDLAVGLLAAS